MVRRALGFLLLLASCDRPGEAPGREEPASVVEAPSAPEPAEEPRAGRPPRKGLNAALKFGELQLGQDRKAVRQKLGPPDSELPNTDSPSGFIAEYWEYRELGLSLTFMAPAHEGPWELWMVGAMAPCAFRTDRGVGIGDPRSAVEAAYSDVLSEASKKLDPSLLIVGGLKFSFDESGTLDGILFNAPRLPRSETARAEDP